MLEALVEALFSAFGEAVLQLIAEVGVEFLGREVQRSRTFSAVFAALVLALFGLLMGVLSVVPFPTRLIPTTRFPGLSLVVAPALAVLGTRLFAAFLRARGVEPSVVSSWWGAGIFAFSMAAARYFLVT
ncbi:MAG: hypothetical protein AB2L07_10275 [Thermoanaerobaculaceae bacterium]